MADDLTHWRNQALQAWAVIDSLRADLAQRDALLASLTARLGAASEVLGRAAERGRVCAGCLRELTEGQGEG